jgi:rhodanese-related sulfurtransferase
MNTITVQEFSEIRDTDTILLDVRTAGEISIANIGGIHIPLDELEERFVELDKSKKIFCLCHHGMRSEYAAKFLDSQGFSNTVNVLGGIDAWSCAVDQNIQRY